MLAHARVDPTFGLIILAAFVIRSDFFVTQSFMSVWVMGASKLEGIDSPQALKTVGLCSMMWTAVLGRIAAVPWLYRRPGRPDGHADRLVGFAALAFSSTLLVHGVDGAP